jgi:hypothetical protein
MTVCSVVSVLLIRSDRNIFLHIRFKAFMVTEHNEDLFADQSCQYVISFHTDMAGYPRQIFTSEGHKVYLWVVSELG